MVKGAAENNKTTTEFFCKNNGKVTQNADKPIIGPNSASTSASTLESIVLTNVHSENQQADFAGKLVTNKTYLKLSKSQFPFSLESEIAKIKIFVLLTELVTQDVYKCQVLKALNIE